MATENKMMAMCRAERKIPAGMRHEFVWYMNEATVREVASIVGMGLPPDEPLPSNMQAFGMTIEVVESREILLVMKVT